MGKCKGCGACCELQPVHLSQVNYDYKWVQGRGGRVAGFHAFMPSHCKWHVDGKCEVQDSKPQWCKDFPESVGPQEWLLNMGCKYYG